MQIILKADLEMEDVLPVATSRDTQGHLLLSIDAGATVTDAVALTSLQPDEPYMVSVNDAIVLKANRATHALNDGDCVTILAPLRGG